MKGLKILAIGVGVLLFAGLTLAAAEKSNAGFEKLKSLAGEWEGKASDGKPVKATYKVTSAGSAVSETLQSGTEPEMLTVYHLDGDHLMMTHYCSLANQPRMRAAVFSGDPKALDFEYVGATNLGKADAPHMHHLAVAFDDTNHITQKWMLKGMGPDQEVTFHLERKR
jgi:hypothetical protein